MQSDLNLIVRRARALHPAGAQVCASETGRRTQWGAKGVKTLLRFKCKLIRTGTAMAGIGLTFVIALQRGPAKNRELHAPKRVHSSGCLVVIVTSDRQPTTDNQQPTTNNRQPTTDESETAMTNVWFVCRCQNAFYILIAGSEISQQKNVRHNAYSCRIVKRIQSIIIICIKSEFIDSIQHWCTTNLGSCSCWAQC